MTFGQQLIMENRFRNDKWQRENRKREINGENIYTDFCVYCNCYLDNESKTDTKQFDKWLKQENRFINFWQLKYLREKYFGYKYTYIHENQKWEIIKGE